MKINKWQSMTKDIMCFEFKNIFDLTLQLLQDKSLNNKVLQELQTEHNLSRLQDGTRKVEKEMADLRKQREEEGSTPEVLTRSGLKLWTESVVKHY